MPLLPSRNRFVWRSSLRRRSCVRKAVPGRLICTRKTLRNCRKSFVSWTALSRDWHRGRPNEYPGRPTRLDRLLLLTTRGCYVSTEVHDGSGSLIFGETGGISPMCKDWVGGGRRFGKCGGLPGGGGAVCNGRVWMRVSEPHVASERDGLGSGY